MGMEPRCGAAQGELGMKVKKIFVGGRAEGDVKRGGAEGKEGDARRRRHNANPSDGHQQVPRDLGHHRVGGRADHRDKGNATNAIGINRDIGVFAIRGDGDPLGGTPHRNRGHHRVVSRVDDRRGAKTTYIGVFPIRGNRDPPGTKPHRERNRRLHRITGRLDHRNIVGVLVRDIGVCPIRGERDPVGKIPHRDRGHQGRGVVAVSITETLLESLFTT